jgi:hypothetical protein
MYFHLISFEFVAELSAPLTVAGTVMETYMYTAGGLTLRGKYVHTFTRLLLSPSVAQNHTPDYDRCTSVCAQ